MVQHTKSASPATPGFDKEAFRKSLLTRSLNQTLSSRAAILPTNEPIVSSSSRCSTARAATERSFSLGHMYTLLLTFPFISLSLPRSFDSTRRTGGSAILA
jgi:hypothetical protein